jgi:hypothetical protein
MVIKHDPELQRIGQNGSKAQIQSALQSAARKRHGLANLWQGARLREQQPGSSERLAGLGQKRLIAEALFAQNVPVLAPLFILRDIARFAGQYGNAQVLAQACAFAARRPAVIGALIEGARLHDHHTRCMPEVSRHLDVCKQVVCALPLRQTDVKPPYTALIERLAAEIRMPEDWGLLAGAALRFHHDPRFRTIVENAADRICMAEADIALLRLSLAAAANPVPVFKPRGP